MSLFISMRYIEDRAFWPTWHKFHSVITVWCAQSKAVLRREKKCQLTAWRFIYEWLICGFGSRLWNQETWISPVCDPYWWDCVTKPSLMWTHDRNSEAYWRAAFRNSETLEKHHHKFFAKKNINQSKQKDVGILTGFSKLNSAKLPWGWEDLT